MRKNKLLVFLISSIFIFNAYTEKISIKVVEVNNKGEYEQATYSRDLPETYEEALEVIEAITNTNNETAGAYYNELLKSEDDLAFLNKTIKSLNDEIDKLNKIIESSDKIDNTIDKNDNSNKKGIDFLNNMKFGIFGEYGFFSDRNEVSAMLAIRFYKITIMGGPNLNLPPGDFKVGCRVGLGYWF